MATCFSLITPVLNGERYIARSYWCLRNQGVEDWEWVIVDDGSTDRTVREVNRLNDQRIKLIRLGKNMGRGFARTVAVNESQGCWTVVWDIDDLYFPDRLSQASRAKNDGKDFHVSGCVVIDSALNITGHRGFGKFDDGKTTSFLHPTLSCKSELLRKFGYDPTSVAGEDFLTIYRLSRGYRGVWSADPIIAYREDSNPNKAREAVLSKTNQLKALQRIAESDGLSEEIMSTIRRVRIKKFFLSLLLVCPPAYKWSFKFRSHRSTTVGDVLSKSKMEFIEEAKQRHLQNNWE